MKKRTREALTPDLTPLIDVVFLLLIFFMVSTVFKQDELALLLQLPKAGKGDAQTQALKNIYIELTSSQIAFNGKKLTYQELSNNLSKIADKKTPVELRIDKDVKYEKVIKLLDTLKKYRLHSLALITDK